MAYTRAAGVTGAIRRALAGASMAEGIGFCSCRSDDRPRPFETAEANRAAYSELSPLSLNVLLRYIIVCSLSDTCKSVAKAHNITTVQLRSYTPRIDGGCYNFNRTIGTEICMDEPWNKYHAPSSVVGSTSVPCTASTAVPTPTNVADNSTRTCGRYHEIKKGDTCDTIVQEFSISREDFLILNPGLNTKYVLP